MQLRIKFPFINFTALYFFVVVHVVAVVAVVYIAVAVVIVFSFVLATQKLDSS